MTPFDKVPFAPLRRALAGAGINLDHNGNLGGVVGLVNWSTLRLAAANGEVSVYMADRIAVRVLNVHPTHIYGDAWLNRDALNDPMVDLRIRALEESWALRQELAS